MKCTYRSIGFIVSALVHLVGAAALLPHVGGAVRSGTAGTPVAVSLAMFEAAAPSPPPVEPEPPVEAPPEPPAEPAPVVAEPPAEPPPVATKIVESPPRPRPVSAPRTPRKPRPEPPKPAPPRVAERAAPASPDTVAPVKQVAAQGRPAAVNPAQAPGPRPSSVRDDYLSALIGRIHEKKYYPRPARRRREEGEVLVSFVIERSGALSNLRISRSSGHDSLDQAAIRTLEKISPFRELPAELGIGRWELAVPIAFNLRR